MRSAQCFKQRQLNKNSLSYTFICVFTQLSMSHQYIICRNFIDWSTWWLLPSNMAYRWHK